MPRPITFRPLSQYPGKRPQKLKRSPFKGGYLPTIRLVQRELEHLQARDVVLQLDADPQSLRNDGWPLTDVPVRSQAVALSFTTGSGRSMMFPCATYTHWQDNLKAIGLALQALRAVNRYGVTEHAEQYRGWERLESKPVVPGSTMTPADAATVILQAIWSADKVQMTFERDKVLTDPEQFKQAFKTARRLTHPDATHGHEETFKQVGKAGDVLAAHLGIGHW